MARAHCYKPVTDGAGNLLSDVTVTVFEAARSQVLEQQMFTTPSGAGALSNPFAATNGIINFYLETPQRVRLSVKTPNATFNVYIDVEPPAREVLRVDFPLRVTNSPQPGWVLVFQGAGQARWQAPDDVSGGEVEHFHDGMNTNSTQLGQGSMASEVESTAVGDTAQATSVSATALGYDAHASGERSTALGTSSRGLGNDSLAVGYQSSAGGVSSAAVGASSVASGVRALAVGHGSKAEGADSVAVGFSARASQPFGLALGAFAEVLSLNGVALGATARVNTGHTNSVAVGFGVQSTAANQVRLGDATYVTSVPGTLRAVTSAQIGGAGGSVGFYGQAPIVKPTVTGSDEGQPALRSLIAALTSLGLVNDTTTKP